MYLRLGEDILILNTYMISKNMLRGNAMMWVGVLMTVLVLAGLFVLPGLNKGGNSNISTNVPCLVPNLPLVIHIHPELEIEVDGVREAVPKDIGVGGVCERALHTHDSTGQLHVEAQAVRDYHLQDFFDVWGKTLEREGYGVAMTVDGAPSTEFGQLLLKDKQKIKLSYNKK
jgi:hypothetical protein